MPHTEMGEFTIVQNKTHTDKSYKEENVMHTHTHLMVASLLPVATKLPLTLTHSTLQYSGQHNIAGLLQCVHTTCQCGRVM